MDQRREAILKSLTERNLLSDELKAAIAQADSLTQLEDIYQPYRPKRRTRAMIAKEQGLEPLADILFDQQSTADPQAEAAKFVSAEKGVADVAAALAGARDILAERISDDATARAKLRDAVLERRHREIESHVGQSRRRPRSSKTISTGASRWPKFPAIGCWPSGAAKRKVF